MSVALHFNFPASDIGTIDYFHPNMAGQNDIARITWGASFWGSELTPEAGKA